MTTLSFTSAVPVSSVVLNNPTTNPFDAPFDKNLSFNRVIQQREKKPAATVYSINPSGILNKLSRDSLETLQKITLVSQFTQGGVGMWDTVFETIRRDGVTACVFAAGQDFAPLHTSRSRMVSKYLDLTKWCSRLQFNRIEVGDKIGISIHDARARKFYVLFYSVQGICTVNPSPAPDVELVTFPGLNCELLCLYRVESDGSALRMDVDDTCEVSDTQEMFLNYLVNVVNDVSNGYPWKAHFSPLTNRTFEREQIEARLIQEAESATVVAYDEFEELCRQTYNRAGEDYRNTPREPKENKPKGERGPKLPVVEVAYLSNRQLYQATLADPTNTVVGTYLFAKPESVETLFLETYLFNQDLIGKSLIDIPGVLVLDEEKFGPSSTLRHLTVYF